MTPTSFFFFPASTWSLVLSRGTRRMHNLNSINADVCLPIIMFWCQILSWKVIWEVVISSGTESLETFPVRVVGKLQFLRIYFSVVWQSKGETEVSLYYLHSYQNGYNWYALTRARIVFILVLTSKIWKCSCVYPFNLCIPYELYSAQKMIRGKLFALLPMESGNRCMEPQNHPLWNEM